MSGLAGGFTNEDLQFDRVSRPGNGVLAGTAAATCSACKRPITDAYFDVNGHTFCARCRVIVQQAAETPAGAGLLLKSALFGFGAAIVGAIIYYSVIAFLHLEIGIVAILTGYMVGYAMKKATGNRGGRRFQILAVVLTYLSIAMAYTPLAFSELNKADQKTQGAVVSGAGGTTTAAPATENADEKLTGGSLLVGLTFLVGLCAALPILSIVSSMPGGLLSALIMFFGLQQAWKMTAAPKFVVSGPYRISSAVTPGA
jgi:hypothetical protein